MAAEILQFKPMTVTTTGTAICCGCKHEWVAVTEGDGLQLECPECSTMKGHFKWPYGAAEGQYLFVCRCGCEDFFIMSKTENGIASVYCRNCGDEKHEWWEK
ncbi:MAG: hypothetical protein ACN6OP_23365 [Pseudomonadales bacterium]